MLFKLQVILIVLLFGFGVGCVVPSLFPNAPRASIPHAPDSGRIAAPAAGIETGAPPTLPVLWDAPDFAIAVQTGGMITETDLRNHVWIADFNLRQRQIACPPMTVKPVFLEEEAPIVGPHFISLYVDQNQQMPAMLQRYETLTKQGNRRWILLATTAQGFGQIATGPNPAIASGDRLNRVVPSSVYILVDLEGRVRGLYNSNDSFAMKSLATDAAELANNPNGHAGCKAPASPVATPAEQGEHLFRSLGCAACHTQPGVAPPLTGLAGSIVKLTDGRTVRADDIYLRESILDPNAKVAAGYSDVMPAYAGLLSDEQVGQLIEFLKSTGSELLVHTK